LAAALLPVAQRVNADLEGAGELFLAELREPSQRHDVFPRLDSALHDATPRGRTDHLFEVVLGELADLEIVTHWWTGVFKP
jgi:hypothetical protein